MTAGRGVGRGRRESGGWRAVRWRAVPRRCRIGGWPRPGALLPAGLLASALALVACDDREDVRATLSVSETLATADTAGFPRVEAPRPFRFPADHGPHPEYLHEWWYFTGNVSGSGGGEVTGEVTGGVTGGVRGDAGRVADGLAGREFGFQMTFFRSALAPDAPDVESPWATRQAYMGHLAVADMGAERFHAFERFGRGALGLAGADTDPPRVWIGDWEALLEEPGADGVGRRAGNGAGDGDRSGAVAGADAAAGPDADLPTFIVRAAEGDVALDLRLTPLRPAVLQGQDGYSRKGPEPGNASHYYSYTRMEAVGTVVVAADTVPVRGTAWLDREWGTSALGPELAGWDWFSLQLETGQDLMVYRLRRKDGTTDPFSAGTLVSPNGDVTRLGPEDFRLEETGSWTADSGVRYPSGWRIRVPDAHLDLQVQPRLRDQELDLAFRYWEGAVSVQGEMAGAVTGGVGYVELTGYDEP